MSRIDPTWPSRTSENFQAIKKSLTNQGDTHIKRTSAAVVEIAGGTVYGLGMNTSDVEVPNCQLGDVVTVGGPVDQPANLTVTGVVIQDGWVQLRSTNNSGSNIRMPGREWSIVCRGVNG